MYNFSLFDETENPLIIIGPKKDGTIGKDIIEKKIDL